ncbi:MAG TPA: GAF domain-containing protein [Gaiellaceae bacterium]|nr:GAF domain-containing protein [Gaiellaceae bacterium]
MTSGSSQTAVEELTREVDALREQQQAITDVLRAVASAGLQPVLDAVVEACRRLCKADDAALWLLENDLLVSVAHRGAAETAEFDLQHPHALDRSTAAGRIAVTRRPVHIPDVEEDPEYVYAGPRPYRSMLGVPILFEDQLIGVVSTARHEARPYSDEDLALVQAFSDQAAIAIANARLIDTVERQRTELARFLSPHVADLISSDDGKQLLAGHRAYVTIAYFDLRGFTTFAETAEPEELIDIVREYHAVAGELVNDHQGTLEHFAGDGLMVFFNDPHPLDDPELHAAKLALAMRERIEECAARWRKRGYELGLGCGIAVGYATLGRIGFEGRYDYGALGSVTNVAARLSDEAAAGQILLSQRAYAALEGRVDARPFGRLELKGLARPLEAYELLALS